MLTLRFEPGGSTVPTHMKKGYRQSENILCEVAHTALLAGHSETLLLWTRIAVSIALSTYKSARGTQRRFLGPITKVPPYDAADDFRKSLAECYRRGQGPRGRWRSRLGRMAGEAASSLMPVRLFGTDLGFAPMGAKLRKRPKRSDLGFLTVVRKFKNRPDRE